nr:hypothetical protein [Niallia taxi]
MNSKRTSIVGSWNGDLQFFYFHQKVVQSVLSAILNTITFANRANSAGFCHLRRTSSVV